MPQQKTNIKPILSHDQIMNKLNMLVYQDTWYFTVYRRQISLVPWWPSRWLREASHSQIPSPGCESMTWVPPHLPEKAPPRRLPRFQWVVFCRWRKTRRGKKKKPSAEVIATMKLKKTKNRGYEWNEGVSFFGLMNRKNTHVLFKILQRRYQNKTNWNIG